MIYPNNVNYLNLIELFIFRMGLYKESWLLLTIAVVITSSTSKLGKNLLTLFPLTHIKVKHMTSNDLTIPLWQ